MTGPDRTIVHVALPVPLRHHFDYLMPNTPVDQKKLIGKRAVVPFGKKNQKIGLIIGTSTTTSINTEKLKSVVNIIDDSPILDKNFLKLLKWISDYYLAPIGELIFLTLPSAVKQGKQLEYRRDHYWQMTKTGQGADPSILNRAKKQQIIFNYLKDESPCSKETLNNKFSDWRNPVNGLIEKGLVEKVLKDPDGGRDLADEIVIDLNPEQQVAMDQIIQGLNQNSRILLDGITGSGKTEIYIKAIKHVVEQDKQALVLVPEIGLTPHFVSRFRQRLNTEIVILHSGLSDTERLKAWIRARNGSAKVIIGTRSAVWVPMKTPGLIIVDEEHDTSYKQQDGIRYSARDIAILRASNASVSIILGSATPSLESLHNVQLKKLNRITLQTRVDNAQPPGYKVIDLRGKKIHGALSDELVDSIKTVLKNGKQALLFQNRRGYSPVQMCHECGWIHKCDRCDLPMTYHKVSNKVLCHHCGKQSAPGYSCFDCNSKEIIPIGHGTERLTETLSQLFPTARVLRIDRDTTRPKGAMEDFNEKILSGSVDILVGTQMLAKGHHFPSVTLVGIIDADMGLHSNDFRAGEKMAQLITQVSGRAGRTVHAGTVMIQTHYPDHPIIRTLVDFDYGHFAQTQLTERMAAGLPPYTHQALLRAEGFDTSQPSTFLRQVENKLREYSQDIEWYGPYPSPIEKRQGRYRFQILIQSAQRSRLQKCLQILVNEIENIKVSNKVRWSLDVDPIDLL